VLLAIFAKFFATFAVKSSAVKGCNRKERKDAAKNAKTEFAGRLKLVAGG